MSTEWVIPSHKISSSSNFTIVHIILKPVQGVFETINLWTMFKVAWFNWECKFLKYLHNIFLTFISYANMNWKVNQRMYKNIKLLKPRGLSANKSVFDFINFFFFFACFKVASFSGTTFLDNILFSIVDLPKKRTHYNYTVSSRIVLLNRIVHLNNVGPIAHVWTISFLKVCNLSGFLTTEYAKIS